MTGNIIGLVGPSGVGKNYIKQYARNKNQKLAELTVFTTRQHRASDGEDRKAGMNEELFLEEMASGKIVAAHQPFGSDGNWYGFSKKQIDDFLCAGLDILTEIHVDNIKYFKERYDRKLFLIGLIADKTYLDHNIKLRESETRDDRAKRLGFAENENQKIIEFYQKKIIDTLIKVGWDNREFIAEVVKNEIRNLFGIINQREKNIKFR